MKAATTPSPSFSPDRPWMAERAMLPRPPHPHPHPALLAGVRWAGWGTATHRHPATWVPAKEAPRSASQKPGQAPLEVNEGDSTAGRTLRRTESRGSGSQWHGSNGPNEGAAQCPRTDA